MGDVNYELAQAFYEFKRFWPAQIDPVLQEYSEYIDSFAFLTGDDYYSSNGTIAASVLFQD